MATRKMIVPPGGFMGFSQQTPAVRALLQGPTRKKRAKKKTTRKKTTKRRASTRTRSKRVTKKKTSGRLVKGSAAAKRRMAELRRMRGRGKRK